MNVAPLQRNPPLDVSSEPLERRQPATCGVDSQQFRAICESEIGLISINFGDRVIKVVTPGVRNVKKMTDEQQSTLKCGNRSETTLSIKVIRKRGKCYVNHTNAFKIMKITTFLHNIIKRK